MLAMGYCTKAEYDEAINDDVYSRIKDYSEQNSTSDETYYTYFQDEVTNEIMEDLQSRLGYTLMRHIISFTAAVFQYIQHRIRTFRILWIRNIVMNQFSRPWKRYRLFL